MTTEQDPRAAWLRDVRAVLGAVEAHPGLPLPYISAKTAIFHLFRSHGPRARQCLAAAEAALGDALGVTFAPGTEADAGGTVIYFNLRAVLPSGLELIIKAWADEVAERRVTGRTFTEVTEWVRLPAEPEEPGSENPGPCGMCGHPHTGMECEHCPEGYCERSTQ